MPVFSSVESRFKRASCQSKYGEWTDWGDCSMNCGYCGKQNRTRTCAPVDGCSEPLCDGDSMEIQSCGTGEKVCLYPLPSCCSNFKKTIDVPNRRFYCGPKDATGGYTFPTRSTTPKSQ
ncbi:hypothetical protein B9Z55_022785 [Caenorhabditis nigoni]|uniref:Uncharacterized protein n=1 Tax=Caenorhabditis nigoni TaxID=1611254 RepID=A0A2G5SLY1_9PELO|nr:hypothetical protein B9Z55_022785 [Caenorhabditis nigoni]